MGNLTPYHNVEFPRRWLVAVLIENMTNKKTGLTQTDLELIERVIYRNGDDIAVSTSRCFERLEETIENMENRLFARLLELEKKMESELAEMRLYVEDASEVVISEENGN